MSNNIKTGEWKKLGSTHVHENPWYKVREDAVLLPNGNPGKYFVLETRASIVVVPYDGEKYYLVKQYRYPVEHFSWSFPMGWTESPDNLNDAKRELKEETGIEAAEWSLLGTFHGMIGISNNTAQAFLATDLSFGQPEREPSEHDMTFQGFTQTELEELLRQPNADGYALATLGLLNLYIKK